MATCKCAGDRGTSYNPGGPAEDPDKSQVSTAAQDI